MKAFTLSAITLALFKVPYLCLCAAAPSGTVVTWGVNLMQKDTNLPPADFYSTGVVTVAAQVISNATAIAAGGSHALALRSDGTVVAWGGNQEGMALGYPTPTRYRTDGQVKLGGQSLSHVLAIAAGRSLDQHGFSIALLDDHTVVAWGGNRFGQTRIPAGLRNVTAVAAGALQGLALKRDGTIASWGEGNPPPFGLTNVVAISAGGASGRNLALKNDGTVADWAVRSIEYVSIVPSGLSNVTAIASGSGHSLALRRDGTVFGWGENRFGEATGIGNTTFPHQSTGVVMIAGQVLSNLVSIAAGGESSMGLKSDGTVVTWGTMQTDVPVGLSNVVAIAAGEGFCLAITTNQAVADRFRQFPH